MFPEKENLLPGPYIPTLILHGGAGNITRKNLPPDLYSQYESSLLRYLDSTKKLLDSGSSALDASVHAVSLMEDDPLFNCGRGSVFTEKGTIEMEASIMVASVDPDRDGRDEGSMAAEQKRGASVSLVRETRHPIQLAREVLLVQPNGKASSMHCQLSGPGVEEWGWREKSLERKDQSWFWTEKRWAEHLRGLQKDQMRDDSRPHSPLAQIGSKPSSGHDEDIFLPSQGTVGAVCMDSWGDVAVATSTGGLTNKKVGRIGDTPTLGAGFWAESWEEPVAMGSTEPTVLVRGKAVTLTMKDRLTTAINAGFGGLLQACWPSMPTADQSDELLLPADMKAAQATNLHWTGSLVETQARPHSVPEMYYENTASSTKHKRASRRRAVAISGTGNGDTFLRTAACRTTAAICRFCTQGPTSNPTALATAADMTAGINGEMQRSAGDRWEATGEGQAGMIGIEVYSDTYDAEGRTTAYTASKEPRLAGTVVSGFNCGGLFRAWQDETTGEGRVMVFREEYH